MSQYTITRTCGHTDTLNITGTNVHGERERQAARETDKMCRPCYSASKMAESDPDTAGLPALAGNDKQVAWATNIRRTTVTKLDDLRARAQAVTDPDKRANNVAVLAAIDTAMAAKTDAGWWIDHRELALSELRAEAVKEVRRGR